MRAAYEATCNIDFDLFVSDLRKHHNVSFEDLHKTQIGSVDFKREFLNVKAFGVIRADGNCSTYVNARSRDFDKAMVLLSMLSPYRFLTKRSHVIYYLVYCLLNNRQANYSAECLWWMYYQDVILKKQGFDGINY